MVKKLESEALRLKIGTRDGTGDLTPYDGDDERGFGAEETVTI